MIPIYIPQTGRTHRLDSAQSLAEFRADLGAIGFFAYDDNMKYWGYFERVINKQEFFDLMGSFMFHMQARLGTQIWVSNGQNNVLPPPAQTSQN